MSRVDDDGSQREDRLLGLLLVFLGLVRVVPALLLGEPFGTEATVALAMIFGGGVMMWRS